MPGDVTGIVLQARMGSERLPGKSLRPLAGRVLVGHAMERLRRATRAKIIILATTDRPEDDALAAFGVAAGVPVYRGDALDVLARYRACAAAFALDHVVRATGDNPFVDAAEVDRLIELHCDAGADFAESFSSGLPIGIGVEVMTRDAIERSHHEGRAPHHREHVDEYIIENPALFRRATLAAPFSKRAPDVSFTIDTEDEFQAAERLFGGPFRGINPLDVTTEMLVSGNYSLRGGPM
jgi:spore coat polysaccharide biosynthesis protein SpsF